MHYTQTENNNYLSHLDKKPENQTVLMKKEPELFDIYKMFKGYEAQYLLVGVGLDVTTSDIIYNSRTPKDALTIVFERWINENKEVTWDKVIEVCKSFSELGKVLSNIKHFLSSQEAYDKYFGKPDRN